MLSDLGGEALLGLVMTARLVLSRLGAALDLGKVAAAAGERFFRKRFRLVPGGLLGLLAGLTDGSFESCPRFFSLRLRGLREPIWLDREGRILDGRNRDRACLLSGMPPAYRVYDGVDEVAFVISMNLHRRHLNESQRAMVAARIANLDHV